MEFKVPVPESQVDFANRLEQLKKELLQESLLDTVKEKSFSVRQLDAELHKLVPQEDLKLLASYGIRGEILFAVPYLLKQNPKLLGYYRLLLGFAQKGFYSGARGLGFAKFKPLEFRGVLTPDVVDDLDDLCQVLIASSSFLLKGISESPLSKSLFRDLTLLTLGAQFRGSYNTQLGIRAINLVFNVIREIVKESITSESESELRVENAAGRDILIKFAADPDIVIIEKFKSGKEVNRIAIEIKGGQDSANLHNRLGEAEKSHQKAKNKGYVEFWTLLGTEVDQAVAKSESPTTNKFYIIAHLLDKDSDEYKEFAESIMSLVGI